ncbi:MAG: Zn-dependent protease with chaperone function [Veillonella sp.]|jgi:Zn-dependent protease with chaperone function|uniref:Zn-dependent protease with chaperone function n=1 Tax=Veillonella dispar TaxID=39778 RepID=UPI0026EC363F|nr:Zn-dependent protease with chaperone function [Veillonella dispar]MBS7065535.1 Zn-dependent protease with chaperone function [Veillonella dispar]MDU2569865.1 Zn-dependent protease with chaperone function [Veillonella sp.]
MKPEFVPWLWIIYVAYVLYKRYKGNNRLEKYEIILAIISLIFVGGGHLLMIYYNLSETGIFLVNLFFVLFMILMKVVFGV